MASTEQKAPKQSLRKVSRLFVATLTPRVCFQCQDRFGTGRASGLRLLPDFGGRQGGQTLQVQNNLVRPTGRRRAGLRIAVLGCRVLLEATSAPKHHTPSCPGTVLPIPKPISCRPIPRAELPRILPAARSALPRIPPEATPRSGRQRQLLFGIQRKR